MTTVHFSEDAVTRSGQQRPLDGVSDFVVETLPHLLAVQGDELPSELARIAGCITPDFHARCLALPPDLARIACLDLAMLNQACGHAGADVPARLFAVFVELAKRHDRLPTMLYEDCVLNNPIETDPRLFATGETAVWEREFLRLHRIIESALGTVINHLHALPGQDKRRATIAACDARMKSAAECFAAFHAMPTSAFSVFRGFYAAPAGGRYFGVSGRFSESINTLRLLLDGRRIGWIIPNYFNELLENIHYYPSTDRKRMIAAIEDAVIHDRVFIDPLAAVDENVKKLAMRLRRFLDTSAGVHFQLVKKFVH